MRTLTGMLLLLFATSAAHGQIWATKLFAEQEYDFAQVPEGAIREHRFELVNPFRHTVHIKGVHTSCGCLTAEITDQELQPGESAAVIARWHARRDAGEQSTTVSVAFDQPFAAEVQLAVHGSVATDIVLEPNACEFGTVARGAGGTREIVLTCTRDPKWRIMDVSAESRVFSAEFQEMERTEALVRYKLLVQLKPAAPRGAFRELLSIKTEPPFTKPLQIDVRGRLTEGLSVSPSALGFGTLRSGEPATRRLVVRGERPFRIKRIVCGEPGLTFEFDEQPRAVQIVPIKFAGGAAAGTMFARILVETNLDDESAELTAHALVMDK